MIPPHMGVVGVVCGWDSRGRRQTLKFFKNIEHKDFLIRVYKNVASFFIFCKFVLNIRRHRASFFLSGQLPVILSVGERGSCCIIALFILGIWM